ncbi:unnamed protein product, partial [Ilex paraguariensis]
DLDVEVTSSNDDTESVKDIHDGYDQLYDECPKENKIVLTLSAKLNSWEVKEESIPYGPNEVPHICELEGEDKSLKYKLGFLERKCHGLIES